VALSSVEIERVADAILEAYPAEAKVTQLVKFALDVELEHVAYRGQPLRGLVLDLLRWARRTHRLGDLLSGALGSNPGNPRLATLVPPLLARLAGEPGEGERVEVPTLAPDGHVRGLMLIAAREHAEYLADLEDAVRAVGEPDALVVVARRYLDPDQPPVASHPHLDRVRVAVMLVGRDLTTSNYLWTPEAAHLVDGHYDRSLRLVPVQLGGFIHATSRLAGLPTIDGRVNGKPLDADTLASRSSPCWSATKGRAVAQCCSATT